MLNMIHTEKSLLITFGEQEYPWTSPLAQSLAILSLSMVLISTVTFIVSTAEELQEDSAYPLVALR